MGSGNSKASRYALVLHNRVTLDVQGPNIVPSALNGVGSRSIRIFWNFPL